MSETGSISLKKLNKRKKDVANSTKWRENNRDRYNTSRNQKRQSLQGDKLDDRREKERLASQKYRARKAQKQQAEAAASKLGLNSSGGGIVQNSPINNGDTNIIDDEDAG